MTLKWAFWRIDSSSHVSPCNKPQIKAAYDVAKQSLSKGEVTSKEVLDKTGDELKAEIESLKKQISFFQEK